MDKSKLPSSAKLITPNLKLAVTIVLIFIIGITLLYWFTPIGSDERFKGYINLITFVTIVIALITFSLSLISQINQNNQTRLSNFVNLTDSYIIRFDQEVANNSNLNRIYKQMNTGIPAIQALPNPPEITPKVISDELHFAERWLQAVENMDLQIYALNPRGWEDPYFEGLKNRVIASFDSQILRDYYNQTKQYRSPEMRIAVEKFILPYVNYQ